MSVPDPTHIDVYARNLFKQGFGYPLWCPEPNGSSRDYQQRGVSVGDVGRITSEGGFEKFFNIIAAANDTNINFNGVPEGFEPFSVQPHRFNERLGFLRDRSVIHSTDGLELGLSTGINLPEAL